MRRRIYLAAMVAGLLLACGFVGTRLMGADAVLDGKRKLADDLFRNGKFNEAATMLKEVIAADASQFRDHLRLARSYEKLNQTTEAAAEYRNVTELLPESPANTEEKLARAEASQRLKALDAFAGKTDAAVDRFLKELEGLEKDATAAGQSTTLPRIYRIEGALFAAIDPTNHGFVEVPAGAANWQPSNFTVVAGQKYRVTVKGRWHMGPPVNAECGADGVPNGAIRLGGRLGQLMGAVNLDHPFLLLGSDVTFTAPASGTLGFCSNLEERKANSGSLFVWIERR